MKKKTRYHVFKIRIYFLMKNIIKKYLIINKSNFCF